MEDDSSNDVIALEPTVNVKNGRDRPLLQFCRRLVNNNFTNIVLTNVQIEDILKKEFSFKLSKLNELEILIYICIVKRFLKDWPLWEEFDRAVKDVTSNGDDKALDAMLEEKSETLKGFLREKLETAKPLAAEWDMKARVALAKKTKEVTEAPSTESVVLEVQATREQLNKLFYRYPHPKYNDTIFNAENVAPTYIRLNTLSLEAILNWWSIRIQINLQWDRQMSCMFLKRETTHKTEHSLVNRKFRKPPQPLVHLNDKIQIKDLKNCKNAEVDRDEIIGCLNLLSTDHAASVDGTKTIIDCLRKDLEDLPFYIAPAEYRRFLNKYQYVRYLYSDVNCPNKVDMAKYDFQLKETMSPMHQFAIGRVEGKLDKVLPSQWLKVECVLCSVTFAGESLTTELMQHFNEYHQVEPDWQCANCEKRFTMARLAETWWRHDCDSEVTT